MLLKYGSAVTSIRKGQSIGEKGKLVVSSKNSCSKSRRKEFEERTRTKESVMKLNKCLLATFACIVLLLCLPNHIETEAQEIITSTSSEDLATNDPSSQDTTNTNTSPRTPNNFLRLLYKPIGMTLRNARQFIGDRVNNVHQGLDLARAQAWKAFMRVYNKTYSPEELPRRMALFFRRREEIQQSVRAFMEGKSLFAMKENSFSDWDEKELKKLTGVSMPSADQLEADERDSGGPLSRSIRQSVWDENEEDPNITVKAETRVPASKDWKASGCVSTPINQQDCGACYAIATMSVVESMKCIKKESAPTLSPQQIVDCATPRAGYSNYGCDGGWPTRVLKYLQDVGVAARDKCYPFVRRQGTCKLSQVRATSGCVVGASTQPGQRIQYKVLHNEQDILYHVANTGPVVTVMKASDKFLYYGKGIFDDTRCSNRRDDVDHAIVITGYGKENGVDYWLIKNSWGTSEWGIDGYAKYRRNKNACSIGHWGWVVTN